MKRLAAISVLALFFIATLPHDFIHEFASHKDTVDVYGNGPAVGNHHIHCKFLRIAIAPYLAGQAVHLQAIKADHASFIAQLPLFHPVKTILVIPLRGPPVIS